MTKILRNFLTASCLAIVGMISSQTNAKALEISITNISGNDYDFTVTLDVGESIGANKFLVLNDLENVTNATASSPFALSSVGDGFDSTNAIFETSQSISGANSFPNAFTITSTSSLETLDINYDLAGEELFSGAVTNNTGGTAVPFEFSPGLGISLMAGFMGLRFLKNRSNSKLS